MKFATVSSKGQIVIPAELRRKHRIKPGSKVAGIEDEGRISIIPLPDDPIESSFGMFKGAGLLRALKEAKGEERN